MSHDSTALVLAGIQLTEEEFYELAQVTHPGLTMTELNRNPDLWDDFTGGLPTGEVPGVCLEPNVHLLLRQSERIGSTSHYLVIKGLGCIDVCKYKSPDLKLRVVTQDEETNFRRFCDEHGLDWSRYGLWIVGWKTHYDF